MLGGIFFVKLECGWEEVTIGSDGASGAPREVGDPRKGGGEGRARAVGEVAQVVVGRPGDTQVGVVIKRTMDG